MYILLGKKCIDLFHSVHSLNIHPKMEEQYFKVDSLVQKNKHPFVKLAGFVMYELTREICYFGDIQFIPLLEAAKENLKGTKKVSC